MKYLRKIGKSNCRSDGTKLVPTAGNFQRVFHRVRVRLETNKDARGVCSRTVHQRGKHPALSGFLVTLLKFLEIKELNTDFCVGTRVSTTPGETQKLPSKAALRPPLTAESFRNEAKEDDNSEDDARLRRPGEKTNTSACSSLVADLLGHWTFPLEKSPRSCQIQISEFATNALATKRIP